MIYSKTNIYFITVLIFINLGINAQRGKDFRIIAYYAGSAEKIHEYEVEKLTHFIYCFGQLSKNKIHFGHSNDTMALINMQKLKSRNPNLKIMISLGGWGGCKTCSEVFGNKKNRKAFAQSVKELSKEFKIDGIDLDWEYPAIKGFPGYEFSSDDKKNFTELVREMRQALGQDFIISFAAGGFTEYLEQSIEWNKVIKYVDFINIMSYDLVHGYSKISGHHTPLYSTEFQKESTDNAVMWLLNKGVPSKQIVIGAAFYGRLFKIDDGYPTELYKPCRFSHAFSYKFSSDTLSKSSGFIQYWDTVACSPYAIHSERKLLASYDDEQSIKYKMHYVIKQNLGGIMFWQLVDDKLKEGLLDVIYKYSK